MTTSSVLVHAAVWVPVAVVVAIAMDAWAGLLHGAVWHRWLWSIHRSHHVVDKKGARFELNDVLALAHAPIAVALILYGCRAHVSLLREVAFGVGVGMTAFAIGYLIVHDGLVHGRVPGVQFLLRITALRRIVRAHRVHHLTNRATTTHHHLQPQVPFSLFFGPRELRHRARNRRLLKRQHSSDKSAPRLDDGRGG